MKKHLFWISELFVWLLVLFIVSSFIMFLIFNYKKNFNTYQIFLPDVDGLINGSPVRFMGIQAGYVNQINIVGEDVYVKFIITDPNVRIPKGSKTTVEFSGLGGSKSLEIYPPDKEEYLLGGKLIFAQSPKRINDSLGLLSEMYDQVVDIAYSISSFMKEIGFIKSKKNKTGEWKSEKANDFLDFANIKIDEIQKKSDKIGDKIYTIKEGKMNGSFNEKN